MKNNKLIGISGRKRSGKDTVSVMINKILKENSKEKYKSKAYAYILKKFCAMLTGIPLSGWYTTEDKEKLVGPEWLKVNDKGEKVQMTRRTFMQELGTGAITSHFHKKAWVNALFADYNEGESKWLVTDVRFFDEISPIQQRNGYTIRILRPSHDDHGDSHISETELDNYTGWDFVIVNDGTKKQLKDKVKNILSEIGLI